LLTRRASLMRLRRRQHCHPIADREQLRTVHGPPA
jgi:hypothetical protein